MRTSRYDQLSHGRQDYGQRNGFVTDSNPYDLSAMELYHFATSHPLWILRRVSTYIFTNPKKNILSPLLDLEQHLIAIVFPGYTWAIPCNKATIFSFADMRQMR